MDERRLTATCHRGEHCRWAARSLPLLLRGADVGTVAVRRYAVTPLRRAAGPAAPWSARQARVAADLVSPGSIPRPPLRRDADGVRHGQRRRHPSRRAACTATSCASSSRRSCVNAQRTLTARTRASGRFDERPAQRCPGVWVTAFQQRLQRHGLDLAGQAEPDGLATGPHARNLARCRRQVLRVVRRRRCCRCRVQGCHPQHQRPPSRRALVCRDGCALKKGSFIGVSSSGLEGQERQLRGLDQSSASRSMIAGRSWSRKSVADGVPSDPRSGASSSSRRSKNVGSTRTCRRLTRAWRAAPWPGVRRCRQLVDGSRRGGCRGRSIPAQQVRRHAQQRHLIEIDSGEQRLVLRHGADRSSLVARCGLVRVAHPICWSAEVRAVHVVCTWSACGLGPSAWSPHLSWEDEVWRRWESNPRHPPCKGGALPTELRPRGPTR